MARSSSSLKAAAIAADDLSHESRWRDKLAWGLVFVCVSLFLFVSSLLASWKLIIPSRTFPNVDAVSITSCTLIDTTPNIIDICI